MQPQQMHELQQLVYGLTSAGLVSVTIGVAFLSVKGKARLPLAGWVLAVLTALLSVHYLLLDSGTDFSPGTVLDCLVAATSLLLGYALWPAVLRISNLPGYEELEEAKRKLEQEVQARLKAESRKAELEPIAQHSLDAIVVTDITATITKWNDCCETFYGYSQEEAVGQSILLLTPASETADISRLYQRVVEEKTAQVYEGQQRGKDGHLIDVILTISPIFDSRLQVTAISCVARDNTSLKESQRQIYKLNAELQNHIDELKVKNEQLEEARDSAIEASQLKSAFVANISHELRTPLSGILGMSELALTLDLNDETRAMLEVINQSGQALLTVVNDILDLSKVEAGRITLDIQPFNLKFVIQGCSSLLAPSARAKKLAFNVDIDQHLPEFVSGDAAKVRQVLINLIGNAVKFTEKGNITVSARVLNEDYQKVTVLIAVTDTGVGISAADQQRLFIPFGQIEKSGTRKYGGTGLGLAISKRFVELMNGQIKFRSSEGEGSCFWFSIPFDKKATAHEDRTPQRTKRLEVQTLPAALTSGRKVLLVEDSKVLNKVILKQLSTLGIDAHGVYNGHDAIEEAATGKYDLVLMDINLPDMSGYEVTEVIRRMEGKEMIAPTAIVALTASAMEGDREKALDAGLDDYIAKPVSIEELGRRLRKWLTHKSKKLQGL
jgi:PAS domain S-box-containing protein